MKSKILFLSFAAMALIWGCGKEPEEPESYKTGAIVKAEEIQEEIKKYIENEEVSETGNQIIRVKEINSGADTFLNEEYEGYQKQVFSDSFYEVLDSVNTSYDESAPAGTWVEISALDKDGTYKALYICIDKVSCYSDVPDYVEFCINENDTYSEISSFDRTRYMDNGLYVVDYEVYVPEHFEDHIENLTIQPVSQTGEKISDTSSAKVEKLYTCEDDGIYLEAGSYYTLCGYYHLAQEYQNMDRSEYCFLIDCPPDGTKFSTGEYSPYDREIPDEQNRAYLSLQ